MPACVSGIHLILRQAGVVWALPEACQAVLTEMRTYVKFVLALACVLLPASFLSLVCAIRAGPFSSRRFWHMMATVRRVSTVPRHTTNCNTLRETWLPHLQLSVAIRRPLLRLPRPLLPLEALRPQFRLASASKAWAAARWHRKSTTTMKPRQLIAVRVPSVQRSVFARTDHGLVVCARCRLRGDSAAAQTHPQRYDLPRIAFVPAFGCAHADAALLAGTRRVVLNLGDVVHSMALGTARFGVS